MSRAAAAMLTLGLVAVSPAASWASGLELRLGAFFPNADSDLFSDDATLYTPLSRAHECTPNLCPGIHDSDWINVFGGAEFSFNLAEHVEMGVSVDGYGRTLDTFYRSDTREDGSDIRQTLKLHLVPVGLSLRYVAGNRFSVAPYVTVGADAIWYEYEEFGDFIDFFDPTRPIVPDSFRSDGWAFGGHAALGVRIPVGHDFAITAEGRYQFAEKKQMDDDFYRSQLDLNGPSATIGVRLRF